MDTGRFNARGAVRGGAFQRLRTASFSLAALVLLSAATPPALAHSHDSDEVARLSIDQLKRFYLWCGRASIGGQLDNGAVMQCSIFYEALKERAFGGDFEKLLAWSRANSTETSEKR
jgi:hypothetical protein